MELHTEISRKEFIVQEDHHGISHRISAPAVVSPEMCGLGEFSVLASLVRYMNELALRLLT
jgi:hypothetical protein